MKPIFTYLVLSLAVIAFGGVVTTKTTEFTRGMTVWENTTLKFQVSVIPDGLVASTERRFWAATWADGTKSVAGVNVPVAGRQITFQLLSWSWKG